MKKNPKQKSNETKSVYLDIGNEKSRSFRIYYFNFNRPPNCSKLSLSGYLKMANVFNVGDENP